MVSKFLLIGFCVALVQLAESCPLKLSPEATCIYNANKINPQSFLFKKPNCGCSACGYQPPQCQCQCSPLLPKPLLQPLCNCQKPLLNKPCSCCKPLLPFPKPLFPCLNLKPKTCGCNDKCNCGSCYGPSALLNKLKFSSHLTQHCPRCLQPASCCQCGRY